MICSGFYTAKIFSRQKQKSVVANVAKRGFVRIRIPSNGKGFEWPKQSRPAVLKVYHLISYALFLNIASGFKRSIFVPLISLFRRL